MPFNRDPLPVIIDRIQTDLETTIIDGDGNPIVDARTPGTGYTEIAEAVAGVAHGLYANQQWLAKQITLADADDITIINRAADRKLFRIPPTFASGNIAVTGTNGSLIESGTVWQTKHGVQVRSTADATIALGVATIPVIALAVGVIGNLTAGTVITLISPVTGVDNNATVAAPGITGGAEIETVARLKSRLEENLAKPPMGGKDYDYVRWAREAHIDVTRAWATPHEDGLGSMTVRFVCEDLSNPIPTAPHITAVANYIATVRPAGLRNLTVDGCDEQPLNLTFTTLEPNNITVRAAVEAELKDLIRREAEPDGTLLLSHIRESISRAAGEQNYVITLATNVVIGSTSMLTVGTTTWP
jgi:uncharacterized phage protein gp47/JayE